MVESTPNPQPAQPPRAPRRRRLPTWLLVSVFVAVVIALVLLLQEDDALEAPELVDGSPSAAADSGGSRGGTALEAFREAFDGVESFVADLTVARPDQPSIEATVEAVLPDRYRMSLVGETDIPLEMIVIGGTTYIRLADAWQVAPATALFPITPQTVRTEIELYLGEATLEQEGTESVDGRDCQVYRSTPPDGSRTAEFCLDPTTSLPLRFVSRSGVMTLTVVFREYDSGITIEPPK